MQSFEGELQQISLVLVSDVGFLLASLAELNLFLGKEVPHLDGKKCLLHSWVLGGDGLVYQCVGEAEECFQVVLHEFVVQATNLNHCLKSILGHLIVRVPYQREQAVHYHVSRSVDFEVPGRHIGKSQNSTGHFFHDATVASRHIRKHRVPDLTQLVVGKIRARHDVD